MLLGLVSSRHQKPDSNETQAYPGEGLAEPAASLKVGGVVKDVYEAGLGEGVIVRPLAGCFVVAPPLIFPKAEIIELGRRVRASLDHVLANQSAS